MRATLTAISPRLAIRTLVIGAGVVDFAGTWGQSARLGSWTSTLPVPVRSLTTPSWPGSGRPCSPRSSSSPRPPRPTPCCSNGQLAGAPAGVVAVADYQSAGRGRFDRRWESPPGRSLLFSVLLRPGEQELPAPRRHLAVAAVSLALVEGAKAVAGAEVQLKWPNDLVVDDLKLAGVLAESASDGSLVVGAGVNVDWAPDGLAGDVLEAPPAAVRSTAANSWWRSLLALDRLYGRWDLVSRRYRTACATVGREVTCPAGGHAPHHCEAWRSLSTNRAGWSCRASDGSQVTVAAGDVTHLRPTGAPSLSPQ